MPDRQQEHIDKLICEGFDRTDWSVNPDSPSDFSMKPPSPHVVNETDNSAWAVRTKPVLVRKRVKVYAPISVGSRLRRQGSSKSKWSSSSSSRATHADPVKTDMKVVIVIAALTIFLMFALYMAVAVPYFF